MMQPEYGNLRAVTGIPDMIGAERRSRSRGDLGYVSMTSIDTNPATTAGTRYDGQNLVNLINKVFEST